MVMVRIVPEHYFYQLIKESGEFVINIPTKDFEKSIIILEASLDMMKTSLQL